MANGGDLIQFIQNYFNISFLEALRKINTDFNLNLNFNNFSEAEIEEFKKQQQFKRYKEQKEKEEFKKKMISLCNQLIVLRQVRKEIRTKMNPYNWEELEEICSLITEQIELIEYEFDKLNTKRH